MSKHSNGKITIARKSNMELQTIQPRDSELDYNHFFPEKGCAWRRIKCMARKTAVEFGI